MDFLKPKSADGARCPAIASPPPFLWWDGRPDIPSEPTLPEHRVSAAEVKGAARGTGATRRKRSVSEHGEDPPFDGASTAISFRSVFEGGLAEKSARSVVCGRLGFWASRGGERPFAPLLGRESAGKWPSRPHRRSRAWSKTSTLAFLESPTDVPQVQVLAMRVSTGAVPKQHQA